MPTAIQNFERAKETVSDPDLLLLEFWEEFNTTKHRAVMNNEDVVFDSETYVAASMEITLPNAGEEQSLPSLSFSNVNREIGKLAINAKGKIICRMILVDGGAYSIISDVRNYTTALWDTEDMMVVASCEANILTVSGDLAPKLDLLLPYPITRTSDVFFPGLYLR